MWVLFTVPCPTPDGRTARDLYQDRVDRITPEMQDSARQHGCRFHQAWYGDDDTFYALALWNSLDGAHAFFEGWDIRDEPGERAVVLDGFVGLVPHPASTP